MHSGAKLNRSSARPQSQIRLRSPLESGENWVGVHILVVDDDEDCRELLSTFLSQMGATVHSASSARDALDHLRHHVPDILISDISMPEMDGYELVREIRTLGPEKGGHLPAVAVTAYSGPEFQLRALHSGFSAHLVKPVELEDLTAAIQNLLSTCRSRSI